MKYLLCFFLLNCLCLLDINARQLLVFEKDSLYIGRIRRSQIPLKASYFFEVADQTVKISTVESDCACLVAHYHREELLPGQKNRIEVEFYPYRSGPFEKNFVVRFEGRKDFKVLKMNGFIEPSYETPEIEFGYTVGKLRLKNKFVSLGTVSNKGVIKKKIEVYNNSEQIITFKDSVLSGRHIIVSFDSLRTIMPYERIGFTIFYHPELKNDFGYQQDHLVLFTDDVATPQVELNITASVKQYVPADIPENVPRIFVYHDTLDLGKVRGSEQIIASFIIMNIGDKELIINKIIPNYGCEIISLESQRLLPNKSATLNVRFLDTGKNGRQERSLTLFSNDPLNTTKEIFIKAHLQ